MPRYQKIGKRVIEFDKTYALCFAGGKRELPKKDQAEYNKIMNLPFQIALKEKSKLWQTPEKDPNVVPIKGLKLLEFIKDLKITPFFDNYFEHTGRIFLTDKIAYEYIKNNTENYFER
jgi:hypothetical protein